MKESATIVCPHCIRQIKITRDMEKKKVKCPRCGEWLKIPNWEKILFLMNATMKKLERKGFGNFKKGLGTVEIGTPENGKVKIIQCAKEPDQLYTCYVPNSYTRDKKWNILYCFGAGGEGNYYVNLFKDVCEEVGWIVVTSHNAQAGPGEMIQKAIHAIWQDTHEKFNIDEKGCYATGFSAGSGMAFWMAKLYQDHFRGVIPMAVSTSWNVKGQVKIDIPTHIAIFFIIGDQDIWNFVANAVQQCRDKGHTVNMEIFAGDHCPPPKNVVREALLWMVSLTNAPLRHES